MNGLTKWMTAAFLALIVLILMVIFFPSVFQHAKVIFHFLTDKDRIEKTLHSFGNAAPIAFVGLQMLQVFFAPFPGEVSGFLGGYLFGPAMGFLYSSIGLSLGSWLGFFTGRLIGEKWVRKLIPRNILATIDKKINREGVVLVFILFVMPGFPKDFLCLFLGITRLAAIPFLIASSVGRMPGTLLLSFEGAYFQKGHLIDFFMLLIFSIILGIVLYIKREAIYRWASKYDQTEKK